ncbi:MAG: PIN domain-containing protein [Vicinamibacterales bacterium]|nr:PIN domain-containing protein [Vicinamibacterales bacterium]
MTGRSFIDSNVLVYTDDSGNPAKQAQAIELVSQGRKDHTGVVSVQVLQEYFVTATKKLGVDPVLARRKVELFGQLDLVIVSLDDVLGAIDLQRLHRLHFWDALIIRSARQGGCVRLLSEDMQHGRRFDGVEIVNPFAQG